MTIGVSGAAAAGALLEALLPCFKAAKGSGMEGSAACALKQKLEARTALRNAAVNDVTGTVQIFTSGSSERAQDVRSTLQSSTAYPVEVIAEGNLYRVRVGPVPEGQLDSVLTQMRSLGYPDAFIRR